MATRKVITPVFRASYMSAFEPRHNSLSGKWEWSVAAIFEPDADLSDLKAIFEEAIIEKWGSLDKAPGYLRSPFRHGRQKSEQYPRGFDLTKNPEYEGKIIVNFKQQTKQLANGDFDRSRQPGVVDEHAIKVMDQTSIYSGMYARAQVTAYAYSPSNADPGVSFTLHHLQKVKDGEPFGGTNGSPEDAFAPIAAPNGAGNNTDMLGGGPSPSTAADLAGI